MSIPFFPDVTQTPQVFHSVFPVLSVRQTSEWLVVTNSLLVKGQQVPWKESSVFLKSNCSQSIHCICQLLISNEKMFFYVEEKIWLDCVYSKRSCMIVVTETQQKNWSALLTKWCAAKWLEFSHIKNENQEFITKGIDGESYCPKIILLHFEINFHN